MNRFNFMKNTEHSPWTLLCSKTNKLQSQLDVLSFNGVGNPKYKSLKYNGKTLVSYDSLGNTIVVYEKLDNKINIYTTETTLKSSFDGKLDLSYISLCDNNWLFTASNDGNFHFYDLVKEKIKRSIKTSYEIPITGFDISLDHRNIFFHYENGLGGILQTKSSKIELLSWINEPINCLKIQPWKKNNLLAGYNNGSVGIFDIEKQTKIFTGNSHKNGINCVASSFYNEHLALSGGKDNQSIVWATNCEKPQKIHQTKSPVTSCSMSDGVFYSFGEINGNFSIFDIRNMRDPIFSHQTQSGFNNNDNSNTIDFLQFKLDLFLKDNSVENFESTIVECIDEDENNNINNNNSSSNANYLDTSIASCFSEPSDHSGNSFSKFKSTATNELANDSFNVSRFSQIKPQQLKQQKFSLSPIIDNDNNNSPNEIRTRKQVQFVNDISAFPINNNHNNNDRNLIICQSGDNNDKTAGTVAEQFNRLDNEVLRQMIREEIENALIPMEQRLRTQLLVEIVDQLAITEKTIIDSLKSINKQPEEIFVGNDYLRKELKTQNKFFK